MRPILTAVALIASLVAVAPASAQPPAAIEHTLTLDGDACPGVTTEVTVLPGTTVPLCAAMTNNTTETLVFHRWRPGFSVADERRDNLRPRDFFDLALDVAPGATVTNLDFAEPTSFSSFALRTWVLTSTWTAFTESDVEVSDTATATITVDLPGANCRGVPATMAGTPGDDRIFGTNERDVIAGLDGGDFILGTTGDDVICGHGGDDIIWGFLGDDRVHGGPGDDDIGGFLGPSTPSAAGSSDDTDLLSGGPGADRIHGSNDADVIRGGRGDDDLAGDRGEDRVLGGDGNDKLRGGGGGDTLGGQAGNDVLRGGSGDDRCFGGPGHDRAAGCERTWSART